MIKQVQWPRTKRLTYADDIIENNGTTADLEKRVKILHEQYKKYAQNNR